MRWIFWINLPIVAFVIFVFLSSWRELLMDNTIPSVDFLGLVALVLGLTSLVFAIMQGPERGWDSTPIVCLFIAAVVLLTAFCYIELKMREPLIEVDLFRNATFTASNLVVCTAQFTKIAVIVFGALYFQKVLGMSPLKAWISLLPAMLPITILAALAGRATDIFGPRWPSLAGLMTAGAALFIIGIFVGNKRYDLIFPFLIIWGGSLPFLFAPPQTAVMNSVPSDKQGQASGINLTAQVLGGTIGLAVLGAVLRELNDYRAVFITSAVIVFVVFIIGFMFIDRRVSN